MVVGPDGVQRGIWAFDNLTPGLFSVSMTWLHGSDRAENVPVVIRDGVGGPVLSSLLLSQRHAPAGPVVGGRPFELIDTNGW